MSDRFARTIPTPPATMAELAKLQSEAAVGQTYCFVPPERIEFIKAAQSAELWKDGQFILNNVHRRMPKIVRRAAKQVPSLVDEEGKAAISLHDLRRSAITAWS